MTASNIPPTVEPSPCANAALGAPEDFEAAYTSLVTLVDALEARYRAMAAASHQRFGQWVMNTCYPETVDATVYYCPDPQKTRSLLLTHWAAGWLPVEPARRFVSPGSAA